MNKKLLKLSSLLTLTAILFLFLRIALTVISTQEIQPDWTNRDYINWAGSTDIHFILNYINAVLFTITNIMLFSLIFLSIRVTHKLLGYSGLAFIPIYGLINLFVYTSQITILPLLIRNNFTPLYGQPGVEFFISQLIQAHEGTVMAYLNSMGYAFLGVPAILFGLALFSKQTLGKISGILLIVTAILCIIGFVGISSGDNLLSKGTLAGSVAYLFAIIGILFMFRIEIGNIEAKEKAKEEADEDVL